MSDILPNCVISDHILPFVLDRSTWDTLVVANREIDQGSRNLEAPWPVGELRGAGYEGDEIYQLCFSSDAKYLCVLSKDPKLSVQRIRMWHKVVGSCACIVFDVPVWRVYFSPVENLLASLHRNFGGFRNMFRLWEVKAEGLTFKVEVQLDDEEVDVVGCTFSRDGRQLILYCGDSTLRIFSVSDAKLIIVLHLRIDEEELLGFVGTTADGRLVACVGHGFSPAIRLYGINGRDGSDFEDVCQGDAVFKIASSPAENSIAIMTRSGYQTRSSRSR
jgi:WD40 repeat protein